MKYPVGVQSFENLIESGCVYVDKTDLVFDLAQKHICFLCRPRRFGKSLTATTLKAYFEGKKELFSNLKIQQLEHDWVAHPVFHLDLAMGSFDEAGGLKNRLESFLIDCESVYGSSPHVGLAERFAAIIHQATVRTGQKAVVLVDEYDKPLLDVLGTPLEEANRSLLRSFFSVFKAADADLRFVLLTGVTKFSQVSVFSGFNQPYDITLDSHFEALCGITEPELHQYFDAQVQQLANARNVSKTEAYQLLKTQYDGYHFSQRMTDIYNPFSIINVLSSNRLDNFWFNSGTPTYLQRLMIGSNININELLAKDYPIDHFANYRADAQMPLPMLFQSGYLTIKNYDSRRNTYRLDFPNQEVKDGFVTLVAEDYLNGKQQPKLLILDIDDMLTQARLDELRQCLYSFFANIDYTMRKDKEWHFQYSFYLLFTLLSNYRTVVEKHNSHGRADFVVETPDYVYIFEFKLEGTTLEALQQIEQQGYTQPYANDPRKLYQIACTFSRTTGTIDGWMVK